MNKKYLITARNLSVMIVLSMVQALSYTLFVFPNKFAPAGIAGIATILQYLDIINVSNLNVLINIPLCLFAFFYINKEYALNSMVYSISFSAFLDVFSSIGAQKQFVYVPGASGSVLATVFAGLISGFIYAAAAKANGSCGGTQVMAMCISKKRPQFNMFWCMFVLNASVAVLSFFVFNYNYDPVFLCVLYCFMSSTVSNRYISGSKKAVRFEIVSEDYKEISEEIINELHHTATLLEGKGIYTDGPRPVLICIINKVQLPKMHEILRKHRNTFAFSSEVNEVLGNYKYKVK